MDSGKLVRLLPYGGGILKLVGTGLRRGKEKETLRKKSRVEIASRGEVER